MSQLVADSLAAASAAEGSPGAGWVARWQRAAAFVADRLNPILVKEARQALKSRQFVVTFLLVLVCAWGWSLLGVAWIGPAVLYGARGREMFKVYYIILSFPLLVIVPFGAYRSLASEREDRTFELLFITTLRPWQVIFGKLAGAGLQMMVYLSAISPCLAFTYLLRGIDVPTILLLLSGICLLSLGLSIVALLLGTFAHERARQVILSVAVIVGLFLVFFWLCSFVLTGILDFGIPADSKNFWMGIAATLSFLAGYALLFLLTAAAQLTFTSANRSTPIRLVLVAQQAVFTGWFAWMWLYLAPGDESLPLGYLCTLLLHWSIAGSMLIGESPVLSPRVRRRLPQSFLGRLALTWFNPGPATAYALVLIQLGLGVALAVGAMLLAPVVSPNFARNWSVQDLNRVVDFGLLAISYVAVYLGIGRLLGSLVRRLGILTPLVPALLTWLLVLFGCLVPFTLQLLNVDLRTLGYTVLQIPNVLWSLSEAANSSGYSPELQVTLLVMPVLALLVAALNLPGLLREIVQIRVAAPPRVLEDEASQHPPAPVGPTSPWD